LLRFKAQLGRVLADRRVATFNGPARPSACASCAFSPIDEVVRSRSDSADVLVD
jgi:hypothetical protein